MQGSVSGVGGAGGIEPTGSYGDLSLNELMDLLSLLSQAQDVDTIKKTIKAIVDKISTEAIAAQEGGVIDKDNPFYEIIKQEVTDIKNVATTMRDFFPKGSTTYNEIDTIVNQLTPLASTLDVDGVSKLASFVSTMMDKSVTIPRGPASEGAKPGDPAGILQAKFWKGLSDVFAHMEGPIGDIQAKAQALIDEAKAKLSYIQALQEFQNDLIPIINSFAYPNTSFDSAAAQKFLAALKKLNGAVDLTKCPQDLKDQLTKVLQNFMNLEGYADKAGHRGTVGDMFRARMVIGGVDLWRGKYEGKTPPSDESLLWDANGNIIDDNMNLFLNTIRGSYEDFPGFGDDDNPLSILYSIGDMEAILKQGEPASSQTANFPFTMPNLFRRGDDSSRGAPPDFPFGMEIGSRTVCYEYYTVDRKQSVISDTPPPPPPGAWDLATRTKAAHIPAFNWPQNKFDDHYIGDTPFAIGDDQYQTARDLANSLQDPLSPSPEDLQKIIDANQKIIDSLGDLPKGITNAKALAIALSMNAIQNSSIADAVEFALLDVFMPAQTEILRQYAEVLYFCNLAVGIYNQLTGDAASFGNADTNYSMGTQFRDRFPWHDKNQTVCEGKVKDAEQMRTEELKQIKDDLDSIKKMTDEIDKQLDKVAKDPNITDAQREELTGKLQARRQRLVEAKADLEDGQKYLKSISFQDQYTSDPPTFKITDADGNSSSDVLNKLSQIEGTIVNGNDPGGNKPITGGLSKIDQELTTDRQGYSSQTDQAQLQLQNTMVNLQMQWTACSTILQKLFDAYMAPIRGIKGG